LKLGDSRRRLLGGLTACVAAIFFTAAVSASAQNVQPDAKKTPTPFSEMKITPSNLAFKRITFGKTADNESKSFSVKDIGTAPLTINVEDPATSDFRITLGAGQTILQPKGSPLSVTVLFGPSTAGTFHDSISVTSEATKGKPDGSVKLEGGAKGTPPTPTTTATPTPTPTPTPPPAPTVSISVSPASITIGSSASLTWSTINATSCTASGAWSGTQETSGTQSVTPTVAGTYAYTLVCRNALGTTATASSGLTVAAPTPTGPLSQVRSFEYALGATTETPGVYTATANSSADLIIMGGPSYYTPLDRSAADPGRKKLFFGYEDVCEASAFTFPGLFVNGTVPPWFGNQNPGYPGLYTVQYWNPAWETALFADLDTTIANGYDGVFLDVLGGDTEWSAGNVEGNPVFPNATQAMATLLGDIRNHINTTYPGKTVYLIGNNPGGIASQYTSSLSNLDGILNETVYYGQSPTNGYVSVYEGTGVASYIGSTLAPLYETAGVPIFGNDYPPLTDPSAVSLSFDFYSARGWIPSVTNTPSPTSGINIFSTGPFMFMSTSTNSTVTGNANFVNYLSGGKTLNAALIGGDQGDYFIGGPGQNTITGGAGNDTIYAHPYNAAQKNKLIFDFSSTIEGTWTPPSVSISINGQTVLQPTMITAAYGTNTQTFSLDTTAHSPISSVSIIVTGTNYVDQSNFSNVEINDISYNGASFNPANGTYSNGGSSGGFNYSNNGTVYFPAAAFLVASPFPANTSDVIDGGGGTNSVIYRAAYGNYMVTQQTDSSWLVTSKSTAEGPDQLTNIQILVFSDQQITLP
jgi:hypothetical protein